MQYVTQALGALNLYHPPKPVQQPDPISMVCMLALRSLDEYKGLRPGVNDNWLSFSTGIQRGANNERSDDLQYVKSTLRLFVKGWDPKKDPTLAKIVAVAIKGLQLLRDEYKAERRNDEDSCNVCIDLLEKWVAPPPPKQEIKLNLNKHYTREEDALQALQDLKNTVCQGAQEFLKKSNAKEDTYSVGLLTRLLQQYEQEPVKLPEAPVEKTELEKATILKANLAWPEASLQVFEKLLESKNAKSLEGILDQHKPKL